MSFRFIALAFLLFLTSSKPPQLSPRDTKVKISEILNAHVSHHALTPELIKRTFENYLFEVDPGKTHLIANEIAKWTRPSLELLQATIANMKKENFSNFEELHTAIQLAYERRKEIEKNSVDTPLPKGAQPSDFKDIAWAKSKKELAERILKIKALQLDAAAKLDQETKDQFTRRLEKRQIKRKEELFPSSRKDRQRLIFSLILKSFCRALDSQTTYFTPAEAYQFMIQVQQSLSGIGAQLRDDLNGFTLVRFLEGGPAKNNGHLRVNDRIIAVNGEPVMGMEITEAVELIRGPKGSKVRLTILREDCIGEEIREEKLDVSITRGEVILTETRLEKKDEPFGDGVIGIFHLFSFYQDSNASSAKDLQEAIDKLKANHNLKGIILDLRKNAGGLLSQAVGVSSLFTKKGIIVSVKDNTGQVQHLRNIDGRVTWDGPLILLTDKTSASASEIVAQSLQDYRRGIVVGDETTYGKGTFQTFTLESANCGKINPKGEFKVTRGRYYTVSGKSPQLAGVHPDIVVPGIYSELEIGEQYAKYPLENESIPANFEDDLSDIPLIHRNQVTRLYKSDPQTILDIYTPYMETLKRNSSLRIEKNKNYQNFLSELTHKDTLSETAQSYELSDLQLIEAVNIIKDLILLMQENKSLTNGIAAAA